MLLDKILHYFPATELPLLLSDDHISDIENAVDQLPQSFIEEHIMVWENEEDDEMTEYIAVASLPAIEKKIFPIVYYKAGLLKYEFIMATFDKEGKLLCRKPIASTVVEGTLVKRSIASIEPDYIINIIAGQSDNGEDYDPSMSRPFSMEVLPDGEIIFHLEG